MPDRLVISRFVASSVSSEAMSLRVRGPLGFFSASRMTASRLGHLNRTGSSSAASLAAASWAAASLAAAGETGRGGSAALAIPGEELPGIHCGLYRVEISKLDQAGAETIPARYNTDTTLGQEVSQRVPPEGVAMFELSTK